MHPKLTKKINKIISNYKKNASTLVHGDFSPKNILTNKKNVKYIDAETSNYGDPVFDVVFFNNHLLIKSMYLPDKKKQFLNSYKIFFDTYLKLIPYIDKNKFVQRCIDMIPIMLIARIDGKSPVEYIVSKRMKNNIRKFSFKMINSNINSIETLYKFLG